MSNLHPEDPLGRDERTLQAALFADEPTYRTPPPGNDAAFIRRVQSSRVSTRRAPLVAVFGAAACAAAFFAIGVPLGPASPTGLVHVAPSVVPATDLPPLLTFLLDDDGDLFAALDDDAPLDEAPATLSALDDESLAALNDVLSSPSHHSHPQDTP